jgi:hypothetical protein
MATPTTQQILTKIEELENYLNELEMIPATHRYRNAVILALLSKALTVSRAICALVEAGFPAEAFAMSRTLIEIYFCVRYISNKDTETRAETYANYHARVRQEWQTIIMKYYPNKTPAEIRLDADVLERAQEFKSKAHWTGHGGQAKMMALEEDPLEEDPQGQPEKSEFDYDALYFWTSHFVHATVVAAEAHAAEPGEVFRVHARSWVDRGRAEDALFNIAVFLYKLFIRACRGMNEEQPDVLQALYKMISDFARPAATPNPSAVAHEEEHQ